MKHAIALAAILATTLPAAAQNHYINTRDGQIVLQEQKCSTGGREATLIESRSNGGGAYGCWEAKDEYVYVQWTQFIGPTGSILRVNKIDRYLRPEGMANK